MDNNSYVPYKQIANFLGIKEGDNIYLASNILGFMEAAKENGESFNPDIFLNTIIENLGGKGTLLIPTFNWDFSNKGFYSYSESPCTTGSLGKVALKRQDFKRTKHPLHSFAVFGKDKNILCDRDNIDSYDNLSPFQYMFDHNAKCIILGTDYKHAYTFIHFVEKKETVPFRFTKKFEGTYINDKEQKIHKEYTSYVRNLNISLEENFNEIGKILEEKKIAKNLVINMQQIKIIDIKASYSIIANDINKNSCKNLYIIRRTI